MSKICNKEVKLFFKALDNFLIACKIEYYIYTPEENMIDDCIYDSLKRKMMILEKNTGLESKALKMIEPRSDDIASNYVE